MLLEFTPLEFETNNEKKAIIKVTLLEFTPLEFETLVIRTMIRLGITLEFTPLEFETPSLENARIIYYIRIYSVGV